jgi:hypothetical protein
MKSIVLTILLVLSVPAVRSQQKSETGQPSYTHDAKGLEKQLDVALQAYKEGKLADVDKQFSRFVVPGAEEWFTRYFRRDTVQELAKRQAEAEDDWETGLTALMSLYPKGTQFHVRCTPNPAPSPRETQAAAGSILPTSPPPIETYLLEFSANKTSALGLQRFASVAVLIFYDGAYRFVGDEDGPFWSTPPKQRKMEP